MYLSGLLNEEKKIQGKLMRTLYSKDMSYLVMLFSGVYSMHNTAKKQYKKKMIVNKATIYVANMDIILTYITKKYFNPNVSIPFQKRAFRVASMYYKERAVKFEMLVNELYENEKAANFDIDFMSGILGNILGELFSWRDDEYTETFRDVGYYLGKYFYIYSAYNNLRNDEKKGLYNPLIFAKKNDPESFDTYVRATLKANAEACMKAVEHLPIRENSVIIKNALYAGVWQNLEEF